MLELNYAFNLIIKNQETRMKEYGFALDNPNSVRPPEVPVLADGKKSYIFYRGPKGRVKIEYDDGKLALYCVGVDDSISEEDMPRASLTLLPLDLYDERDLKYIFDEYAETLDGYYGNKKTVGSKKLPVPVSKGAAKSGALSYDTNTLGNRFASIYPELKDAYRQNHEKYGEFLCEEFFIETANQLIIDTLRENNKIKVRKLFNLLNDIYEDGTNETQSVIAVTILGELYKEPELFEIAKEYMSDTMLGPVTEVVKYLSSNKSKGARIRLSAPPPYKPPKQKKESQLMKMLGM